MRKLFSFIIGGIIALGVIIFLAIQLSISVWIKNNYQSILNTVNTSPNFVLKVMKFERGWFTSKATVQVTIKSPWLQTQQRDTALVTRSNPIQFTVQQRIKNGPWIFGAHKFLWATALIQSTSDNANFKFNSQTVIHFNNATDTTFKAKSMTIANTQQQFVVNDMTSHSTFSPKTQRMNFKISLGSAMMAEKQSNVVSPQDYQQKIAVKNLTFNGQLQQVKPIWYGNRSIAIDKVTYHNSQNQPIVLTHVILSTQTSRHNSTSTSTINAHANSVTGADLNLQPIDLKLAIGGMDTQAIINLSNAALKLRSTPQLSKQQLQTLHLPFIALINKGFSAMLDHLNVGTPEGMINATAHLTVPKRAGASNILLALENTSGELHLQMPMAWLQRQLITFHLIINASNQKSSPNAAAKQQIQHWLTNKKLIQEGQNVKISITYENGRLLINGLPPSHHQAPVQIYQYSPHL